MSLLCCQGHSQHDAQEREWKAKSQLIDLELERGGKNHMRRHIPELYVPPVLLSELVPPSVSKVCVSSRHQDDCDEQIPKTNAGGADD